MKLIDYLAALLAAALLVGSAQPIFALYDEPEAICDTDTDCARHCPPPADDPDCDGGPQS